MFRLDVITLVPSVWSTLLSSEAGLVGRACTEGIVDTHICHLRDHGKGIHKQVDDAPFGGGAGMVLCIEPLVAAIRQVKQQNTGPVLLMGPRGKPFKQHMAQELSKHSGIILICPRYEGVDERVRAFVDMEISIGDHILSAGDPAAWCVADSVIRLLPGVLGNPQSLCEESFAAGRLEYPHYSRPAVFEGMPVPDVLRSGDHQAIQKWRAQQSMHLTRAHRPDLLM